MPLHTRRYNDPAGADDGYRVLVCRFRPRGVKREAETWDAWCPHLGPSAALHAAYYGKTGPPITWETYRAEYLRQMQSQGWWIRGLAAKVAAGDSVTLLCSSACVDPKRCHRTLLAELIAKGAAGGE